jgi:hypothetical protein
MWIRFYIVDAESYYVTSLTNELFYIPTARCYALYDRYHMISGHRMQIGKKRERFAQWHLSSHVSSEVLDIIYVRVAFYRGRSCTVTESPGEQTRVGICSVSVDMTINLITLMAYDSYSQTVVSLTNAFSLIDSMINFCNDRFQCCRQYKNLLTCFVL